MLLACLLCFLGALDTEDLRRLKAAPDATLWTLARKWEDKVEREGSTMFDTFSPTPQSIADNLRSSVATPVASGKAGGVLGSRRKETLEAPRADKDTSPKRTNAGRRRKRTEETASAAAKPKALKTAK